MKKPRVYEKVVPHFTSERFLFLTVSIYAKEYYYSSLGLG
jgi:hypothetical protein